MQIKEPMEQKTKLEQKLLTIHLQGVFLLSVTNSHFRESPPQTVFYLPQSSTSPASVTPVPLPFTIS